MPVNPVPSSNKWVLIFKPITVAGLEGPYESPVGSWRDGSWLSVLFLFQKTHAKITQIK